MITRLLAEEFEARGKINLWGFYLRRFLRLTPPLLSLLVVYLMIAPRLWPQFSLGEHIRDAALAGFYLSDYARAFWGIPKVLQHTWSLSVEEHYYLLWPFVVLLLTRIELRWRIACLLGLYLLATMWRIFNFESLGWSPTYFRFDTRMSGLIFGALLAMGLPLMGRISEKAANGRVFSLAPRSCLPLDRLLECAVVFGLYDEPGPVGRRRLVDRGLGTKHLGVFDVVGVAACQLRYDLLRRIFVALSRRRLLQGSAALGPDRPDCSGLCHQRGDGQLPDH